MLNIGSGELILIAVVALLVLGPKRLPELARGIGKVLREFRRQTDDVRGVVEREFYRMDQELDAAPPPVLVPVSDPVPTSPAADQSTPTMVAREEPPPPTDVAAPPPAGAASPVAAAGEPEKKAS